MSTGLLNPYIRIEPEFKYPQKYYLIQDLTGNVVHTTTNSNIFSNINPFPNANVGSIGIIRCSNTQSIMRFRPPVQSMLNNAYSIQFYMHSNSITSNGPVINVGVLSTQFFGTSNIRFVYNTNQLFTGSAVIAGNVDARAFTQQSTWNHYMFSLDRSNVQIHVNGRQLYTSSSLNQPFSGDLSTIVITPSSNVVLLSDIKITREYLTSIIPEPTPFKITNNTHALITGEFDPLYHTKFFSNTSGTYSLIPNPDSFTGNATDTLWWRGWLPSNTLSNTNFIQASSQKGNVSIVIGSTDGTRQFMNTYTGTTLFTDTFNSLPNTYVPFYIFGVNSANTRFLLNGKNVTWSTISRIQLSNGFKIYSSDGTVLEGSTPNFGTSVASDLVLTPLPIGSSNIVTASNIGLGNGYGGYLGFDGSGFKMTHVSGLTSNDINISHTWNFTPLGVLSNSRSFVSNIFIEPSYRQPIQPIINPTLLNDFPNSTIASQPTDYPKFEGSDYVYSLTASSSVDNWFSRNSAPALYYRLDSFANWIAQVDIQIPASPVGIVAGFTVYPDTDGSLLNIQAGRINWGGFSNVIYNAISNGSTLTPQPSSPTPLGTGWLSVRLIKNGNIFTFQYKDSAASIWTQTTWNYTYTPLPTPTLRLALMLRTNFSNAVGTVKFRNLSINFTDY